MSEIPKYSFALREDLINDKQFLPTRAEPKASGWDVRIALPPGIDKIEITPMEYVKISLGFRAFCPEGWWLELKPRSSTFTKKHLHALYGTIDETYSGDMIFAAQYVVPLKVEEVYTNVLGRTQIKSREYTSLVLLHGEAIGQIIPVRRKEMMIEEVTNEDYDRACQARAAVRGSGGFGSTGK